MNVKLILAKLATRPAADILKVLDWMLENSETHWAAEVEKHSAAASRNHGTSLGEKAAAAHSCAFDNWHAIRQIRQRISKPVRLLGRLKVVA